MPWIQSLDGRVCDLLAPDAANVDITVVAEVLAKTCRFKGHCKGFYSVAEHSVLVSRLVGERSLKLCALLHDAHEVYDGFGDIASPAKQVTGNIKSFLQSHARIHNVAIAAAFGLRANMFDNEQIRIADLTALAMEKRDIMAKCEQDWIELPEPPAKGTPELTIRSLEWRDAKALFLKEYERLI